VLKTIDPKLTIKVEAAAAGRCDIDVSGLDRYESL